MVHAISYPDTKEIVIVKHWKATWVDELLAHPTSLLGNRWIWIATPHPSPERYLKTPRYPPPHGRRAGLRATTRGASRRFFRDLDRLGGWALGLVHPQETRSGFESDRVIGNGLSVHAPYPLGTTMLFSVVRRPMVDNPSFVATISSCRGRHAARAGRATADASNVFSKASRYRLPDVRVCDGVGDDLARAPAPLTAEASPRLRDASKIASLSRRFSAQTRSPHLPFVCPRPRL